MKNSKETRTCIGCREKHNKYDLMRIVNLDSKITVDFKQNLKGRGTYICKSQECFNKVIKNKSLSKAFKIKISDDEYNELRGVVFDK